LVKYEDSAEHPLRTESETWDLHENLHFSKVGECTNEEMKFVVISHGFPPESISYALQEKKYTMHHCPLPYTTLVTSANRFNQSLKK